MQAKILNAVCCLSSALFVVPANAAEWKPYFRNAADVSFSIDTSSIAHLKGGGIRAWQKQEPKDGDGFLYLLEVDCKQRRHIIRSITPINGTSNNIQRVPSLMELYGSWAFFEPNDLDEATYSQWCRVSEKK